MGPLGPVTQNVLLGTAVMMAIPPAMVFLSTALPASLTRWASIILGVFYTAIMLMTMPGSWAFYIFLGVVEVALSLLIVWHAWTWPKESAA